MDINYVTFLNAALSLSTALIVGIPVLIIGVASGAYGTKQSLANKLDKSKATATKMIEDALAEVKIIKKEAVLEAKEQVHNIKESADKEIRDKKFEVQRMEDRLAQKEDNIDKRQQSLDDARRNLERREEELVTYKEELSKAREESIKALETISKMTQKEAKEKLIKELEDDAKVDAAKLVRQIEENAKNDAVKKAKNIISLAVQKCAADHASEITVSSVILPNDEMKGRIIGREGRNVRALEKATGIDFIIDDTPEAIVLSGFDPVRRQVAKIALEKLMMDGRIHPARIEEVVGKVQKDMDQTIKEAGENAAFDMDIHNLHPEIVKTMGRLKYRTSYGQNVLNHSKEVGHLAGLMAAEIGANVKIAKRGGFLHDLGKAVDHDTEGTHVSIGVQLAGKYKETPEVIHCIAAHHGDIEATSIEAVLVQAADAISSARPGARRESLENYIKRLKELEDIANSFDGVDNTYAIQAGREVRIIVNPKKIDDNKAMFLAKDIAKKIEAELNYPGNIKVNVIRESRSVEYAK